MGKVCLLYFSPTGGTEKVVRQLGEVWEEAQKQYVDLSAREPADRAINFAAGDICIVGAPSFGGRVLGLAAERMAQLQGNGALAVPVVVFGNRAYEDTLVEMQDLLTQAGFVVAAGVAAVAQHSMMPQFAAGRPDAEDLAELYAFSARLRAKLESGDTSAVTLPGNRPYKVWGGPSLKPVADETCVHCETCARKCPAGAIPMDDPSLTDNDKCIGCMRCIVVCPMGARSLDAAKIAATAERMKPVFAERKKNELYL